MHRLLAIFLSIALPGALTAQVRPTAPLPEKVTVFLDCRASCDFDLLREEVVYVDWVREATAADVHVLVTSQDAGGGGSEYTLAFLGTGRFATRSDTLSYVNNPTMTSDETRRRLVRTVAMGLMPFVARTGAANTVRIATLDEDEERPALLPGRDPWRAWVFETGVSLGMNGERSYRSRTISSDFNALRVTHQWKFDWNFDHEYEDERAIDVETDDEGRVVSEDTFALVRRNWELEGLVVRSVTPHLSAGLKSSWLSNTFRNYRRALTIGPAVEYNIFPYTQTTRRELSFQYGVGYQVNRYVDTTIFDKIRESLPFHYVSGEFRSRQRWGSVSIDAEHLNYITDASKRNTELSGEVDVRVFRGLSININANYNWIHDQIYLPRGGHDQVDVLLRRRALLTSFDYGIELGLNYTFGSIFNNIVNPRF
jgi:hypothetical protein